MFIADCTRPSESPNRGGKNEHSEYRRMLLKWISFSFPKQTVVENRSARSFQAKDLLRNCRAWSSDFPTAWSLRSNEWSNYDFRNSRVWKYSEEQFPNDVIPSSRQNHIPKKAAHFKLHIYNKTAKSHDVWRHFTPPQHASSRNQNVYIEVFKNEEKEPEEEANEKWITKIFYCQSRRGGEASPVFSVRGWSDFRQRRTLLKAETVVFWGCWPSGFAGTIDCVKISDWYCLMNQKPIASCEFLLWESQQMFSSSVYGCEFTASIALHNFGFSFESFLRLP